jgi:hypothetical protein
MQNRLERVTDGRKRMDVVLTGTPVKVALEYEVQAHAEPVESIRILNYSEVNFRWRALVNSVLNLRVP